MKIYQWLHLIYAFVTFLHIIIGFSFCSCIYRFGLEANNAILAEEKHLPMWA